MHRLRAELFEAVDHSLQNLTSLELSRANGAEELCFAKCLNLKVLALFFVKNELIPLRKIPALDCVSRLSKLSLFNVTILVSSLSIFDGLFALNILEFGQCCVTCDWITFGMSVSRTPVKSVIFRNVRCSVEDIESFLDFVKLDYLYLSNFLPTKSAFETFRNFQDAFFYKRQNPRNSFLIEQDGYGRIHNGVMIKSIVEAKLQHNW